MADHNANPGVWLPVSGRREDKDRVREGGGLSGQGLPSRTMTEKEAKEHYAFWGRKKK